MNRFLLSIQPYCSPIRKYQSSFLITLSPVLLSVLASFIWLQFCMYHTYCFQRLLGTGKNFFSLPRLAGAWIYNNSVPHLDPLLLCRCQKAVFVITAIMAQSGCITTDTFYVINAPGYKNIYVQIAGVNKRAFVQGGMDATTEPNERHKKHNNNQWQRCNKCN